MLMADAKDCNHISWPRTVNGMLHRLAQVALHLFLSDLGGCDFLLNRKA